MTSVPLGIRIAGALCALWYVIGTLGYVGSLALTPEEIAALPLASQEVLALRPAWITPIALVSLGAGLLGSIGLVVGRRWAAPCFLVALVTNVPYAYFALVVAEAARRFGPAAVAIQSLTLIISAVFAWVAYRGRRRGWLT